ncbi:ATP-binding cassette domain-containing protein [Sulfurimonas sp.]|uniref:ABC transporter ATP-binding protein/permease n=1 Tax=Sulfurimonas sp. TaxID=2022749 RepID=UPI003568C63B
MLNKLRDILTRRDKKFLLLLIFFSIFISIIEVIGISAIMPFMSIAMDFNNIHINKYYMYIYNLFQLKTDVNFVMLFGIVLIVFYIFRSAINIFYAYLLAKFSYGRYYLIAYRLFENYMGMSYKNFVKKNSSILTKSIVTEASNLTSLLSSVLFMISEIFVVVLIYGLMLYVNYKVTLLLTLFLLINAILMIKTISNKIKKQGTNRAKIQENFYEIINKSFGNFKFIKLQATDNTVLKDFSNASYNYSKTNIIAQTLLQIPRLLLEAIAFSLIIGIVLYLVWKYEDDISTVLSLLSMFVLALYRLMPSINRILNSYNNILFTYKALDIIHNDLMYDNEILGEDNISFNKEIIIKNLNFEYEKNKPIIKNINIKINKGSKIAFVGESGSGKSTLVDLVIGLYKPHHGTISVDDIKLDDRNIKSWRSKIGYIPQSVYLFDGTVGENVSFYSEYDKGKIIECLKQAKIYDFLEKKDGLDTIVGEGGIMLSGGQKQRIAIARALYIEPEILVLDEATSALDDETESQIMDEIYDISKDKTLLIIAHRLSTIQRCEKVYKIRNGNIENAI